jgi:putative DNA primase/helicase
VQNFTEVAKTGLAELAVDIARDTGLAGELAENIANPVANPVANPQTLTQSAANSANPISSPFTEFLQWFSNQPQNEREKMLKILTQPQPAAPAATQELRSQNTQPEPPPQNKSVTPEDAEKLRGIALIWWDEYYPEHEQSLMTQMFGWNEPGRKYDLAVIAEWLETQEDLVKERIAYLMNEH